MMLISLKSDKPQDNVKPKIEKLNPEAYVYPVGENIQAIDYSKDFEAVDNIDGKLDIANATFEIIGADSKMLAEYVDALQIKIKDSTGNESVLKQNIIVFDDKNTILPTLVAKEEYRQVKLDEDANIM